MEIKVRIKNIYGTECIYPACMTAIKLKALGSNKTFSQGDIETIKALGYAVNVETPNL